MELAAEKETRGALDQRDKESRDILEKIVGIGTSAAGFAAPEALVGEMLWESLLYVTGDSVGNALDASENPRTSKLEKERIALTIASHYSLVRSYIDGKYQMSVSPAVYSREHSSIVDGSGNLLGFNELRKDDLKWRSYRDWLHVNGLRGSHDRSFGQSSADMSAAFVGARDGAADEIGTWKKR